MYDTQVDHNYILYVDKIWYVSKNYIFKNITYEVKGKLSK